MGIALTSLRLALRDLLNNKVRSGLTLLGMFIGVMAVISIVSLGEGIKTYFSQEISALGSDRMYMVPEPPKREGVNPALIQARNFTLDQVEALTRQATTLQQVEPSPPWTNATAKFQNSNYNAQITGGSDQFLAINNYKLSSGRNLTRAEAMARERVAVLGSEVAKELFPAYIPPVGQTIRLKDQPFLVIGVLERKGASGGAPQIDKQILIPMGTMLDRIRGDDEIFWIDMQVKPGIAMDDSVAEVTAIMRALRRVTDPTKDDFQIIFPSTFLEFGTTFINILVAVFGIIGAISLLVGGIGISNIMLVAVTERTREIGLRKALGAPPRAIMLQFLIEAITLTMVGGLLGMAGGYLASYGLVPILRKFLADSFAPEVPVPVALATVAITVIIGVVFGTYPAIRAARLDPIQALRYE